MRTLFTAAIVAVSLAACAAAPELEDDSGDVGQVGEALSNPCTLSRAAIRASTTSARARAIDRGFAWLDADVPYSQSRSRGGYRTDCSGFVSMVWQLDRSYTTASFVSGGGESHLLGSYSDLLPADGLVYRSGGSGHAVIFLGWNDAKHTSACVLEQASTASDMQFRTRTASSLRSAGFKAFRADSLRNDKGGSPAPADEDTAGTDEVIEDPVPPKTGSPMEGKACSSDGACNPGNDGSGLICSGGQCIPGCRASWQCPGVTRCVSGMCR
ncbi:MAG: hypothetical protein KC657_09745 [Myxococcales bacterium]|nr:hypothetical protein [Myxococcales bacterium]